LTANDGKNAILIAVEIATVSTPLTWDELASADPDDYTMATMATVPDLVARRADPWADIDSKAQSIEPLLDMVRADEERASVTCHIRRTIRRCRASRSGFSRAETPT
jgi:hypothetical protein